MKHKTHLFLLLLMVLAWGLNAPINKIGLAYTSPSNYMELRLIVSTFFMFLIAFYSKNLIFPSLKDLPLIFMMGIFQIILPLNLSNYGLSLVDAGKSTFLIFSVSIWIIPLEAILKKKLLLMEGLSLCLGIIGTYLLITPWTTFGIGEITLLLGALSWAVGIIGARRMTWHKPAIQLLPWQLLFATICTVVFTYSQNISLIPTTTNSILIFSLLYTGIISTIFCYYAMFFISKHLSPAIVSLGLLFVPIISLYISYLFLQEPISFDLICGIILLTLGISVHIYAEKN